MLKHVILKFAIAVLLLTALPTLVKSQSLPESSTPSTQTVQVPISLIEKAKQAADEVAASRILIEKQQAQIDALTERLTLEKKRTELLEAILAAKDKQLELKDTIIVNLQKERDTLVSRNSKLERSNKRLKKIGTVLGAAASVFGFIVFH